MTAAAATKYDRPGWMDVAAKYNGLREIRGPKHEPLILKWMIASGHPQIKDDETPWCAAYIGGVLKEYGLKGTNSLAARSYEGWGVKLKTPVYGAIGTKRRGGRKAASWMGHVGFVVAANATHVWLLGGNQNDGVNIARFARSEFTAFVVPYGCDVKSPAWPKLPKTATGAARATES